MPDNTPCAAGIDPEDELAACLFREIDPDGMPPQLLVLLQAYALQRLRRDMMHQGFSGLGGDAARQLCRAMLQRAVAEFTAWTPLAPRSRPPEPNH